MDAMLARAIDLSCTACSQSLRSEITDAQAGLENLVASALTAFKYWGHHSLKIDFCGVDREPITDDDADFPVIFEKMDGTTAILSGFARKLFTTTPQAITGKLSRI
jgi:hypothetical protein